MLNGIRTHGQSKGRGFQSRVKPENVLRSFFQVVVVYIAAFASFIMSTFNVFNFYCYEEVI